AGARSAFEGGEPALCLGLGYFSRLIVGHPNRAAMLVVYHEGPLAAQTPIHVTLRFEESRPPAHNPDCKVMAEAIVAVDLHVVAPLETRPFVVGESIRCATRKTRIRTRFPLQN